VPEKNGRAQRDNKTFIQKVRTMTQKAYHFAYEQKLTTVYLMVMTTSRSA
jgi:hypothetical protein